MERKSYRQGTSNEILLKLITDDKEVKPKNDFNRIIGQEDIKNKISFFLNSNSLDAPMPTLFFTGSHGLGKTYMAETLAYNLGRKFIEINSKTIETAKDLIEGILIDKVLGSEQITILFDEAHGLNNTITTLLLSILSPNSSNRNYIEYKGLKIIFDLTKVNTIFATTDSYKVFPALVNRCEVMYFGPYSNKDLIEMLEMYLPSIKLDADKEDLAYACRGRGRDTFALSQKIKRYCATQNKSNITQDDWKSIKEIFGYNNLGLNNQELNLIRIIGSAGIISCSGIASKMMVSEETIEAEIETRPRELGLIINSSRGRQLTKEGKEYLKNSSEILLAV
jgi:Holliday junction resolvasome RuvABC ATP-dependent DNA helicase subunit